MDHTHLELELEAILHASNDNIIVTDGNGIVLRAIKNSDEFYGESSESMIGRSVYELEQKNIFSPSVTVKVLEQGQEVQLMQKTAVGKTIMAKGIPVFDRGGNIVRVISLSHDLTEIQKLKEDYEKLQSKVERYESEIEKLREQETAFDRLATNSPKMRKARETMWRVAPSEAAVLLSGESGVGKTIFARAIHQESGRHDGAFIEVNCGAIPASLAESEMFGYEPGAFTGASQRGKKGLIESADKGTLFLDEVGELSLEMQVKLLKVLQEKEITKIGAIKSTKVDFRLVAATNRDLKQLVEKGEFREDLFYRLHVVPVEIPPLRERKEDFPMLVDLFLTQFNQKYNKALRLHSETMAKCLSYHWPGNVRELENTIERLVIMSDQPVISPGLLSFHMETPDQPEQWSSLSLFEEGGKTLKEMIADVETQWLRQAERKGLSTYQMAKTLGISQPTVVRRLQKIKTDSK
ncbi:sigma 54-interacting transcriptional regulator [Domibacillus sp. PGB-M46]|uniref:sigma-54 interaction domain-containing protein n=1 Tax=Domibacillus sp. PGB-M46 TaxID=2910255 RepID=UPI001F5A90F6|nr:sigma 54-interacting transcriptional regulator [Domibacillus sp. PGB-M46]MCI2254915.1 sigma 54-interacting transcriptional regulator [Domibacillus sp. PGB-M46]